MNIVDRFLKYVSLETTSDENSCTVPSTPGQMVFAHYLAEELKSIGLTEISLDDKGYIMATLEANSKGRKPVIGFIAHMDTSPDVSGRDIHTLIEKATTGRYKGQEIIKTDGTTLLGADDKAGIAEIVTAMEYLVQHPEIKHGKVRIGFTPDEEIGRGADHFDVKAFGADWAYTMDGGSIGELEYENFNAAACKITIHGTNVHPGNAYRKMVNSMLVAQEFNGMLPAIETPAHTRDYDGFYHLIGVHGTVEETTLSYIIRDHDRARFEERKRTMQTIAHHLEQQYGKGTIEVELRDQYYNMREMIEPVMHVVELAKEAMLALGIAPIVKPIRGGTDGARLSFEGLPCPNIFAGGENFHSRFEYVPIPSLEAAYKVIIEIIKKASIC